MKNTVKLFGIIAIAALIVLVFPACDNQNGNNGNKCTICGCGDDPCGCAICSPVSGDVYVPGTYLLTTTWGNGTRWPYNSQQPLKDGAHVRISCFDMATSQIMKYHEHPQGTMTGIIDAYTSTHGVYSSEVNLAEVAFDWGNMRNSYIEGSYTEIERLAVANLITTVAKSVRSNFGGGSSSPINRNALRDYFNYAAGIRRIYKNDIGDNWENIIRSQIDSFMPVWHYGDGLSDGNSTDEGGGDNADGNDDPGGSGYIYGGNHAYVLDGYNSNGEFHVNWGWIGKNDGWYKTFAPGGRWYYNDHQNAVINIMPSNALSDALSNALSTVEAAHYGAGKATVTTTAQAKTKVEEIITTLDLGEGVSIKVYDVGISPYPFTASSIGSADMAQEYKFVVSLTKDSVTFTGRILALTLVNFAGDGAEQSPYQIADEAQLKLLADLVNNSTASVRNAFSDKHYILTGNINLSAYDNWTPIGSSSSRPFSGVFDGNGKIITGLTINTTDSTQGLFGYISEGIVKNLGLEDVAVTGGDNVGGIAGTINDSAVIFNCYTAGVITGSNRVGGIAGRIGVTVGKSDSGIVENCYSIATVNGAERVGGIAGYIETGVIRNNAALNEIIVGTANSRTNRIIGSYGNDNTLYTLQNNVAFASMLVNGAVPAEGLGLTARNGANITAADILADGTLGGRFTSSVWTTVNGKLPGFGQARSLPDYIH